MKSRYKIRDARHEDVLAIAHNMRKCDIDEIWASAHIEPLHALSQGMKFSKVCKVATVNDVPIAMFGVVEAHEDGCGCVWMLGTDGIAQNKSWVGKMSRIVIDEFLKEFSYMFNFVDARNKTSVEWLKRCGATVFDPQPYGLDGKDFHFFEFRRVA